MYIVLMFVLITLGLLLAYRGVRARKKLSFVLGSALALGTAVFFWFMGFWGEMLWFAALGYDERFWDVFAVRLIAGAVGVLFSGGAVYLLTMGYSRPKRLLRYAAILLAALVALNWGAGNWETILRFLYGAPTALREPILGHTVGFYFFTLPMLDSVQSLLLMLILIVLGATIADAYLKWENGNALDIRHRADDLRIGAVYRAVGLLLVVMAFSMLLRRYHLMYSDVGPITGPGWTDVNIRLPAMTGMIVVLLAAAVVVMVRPLRRSIVGKLTRKKPDEVRHAYVLATVVGVVLLLQSVAVSLVPAMFQSLRVEPNEITFERPYIGHNIAFTRHGFRLDGVEKREYPAEERFTPEMVKNNPAIFNNIRLWDWRALDAVYKQFQEIRLYYEFDDVDVDRYTIDGGYRQVMVSAREMEIDNLPAQSQTFVNRRFKYTHGYGITMTNVSDFTEQGLPDLLIRDIPPKSRFDKLAVERPEIYYGELTKTPVYVNSREKEFDYPRGEENAYVRYQGNGGVEMNNLWRKFLYGWKFDGTKLLFSGYPKAESRFMFHRQIRERAKTLAPFLEFDDDPYIVLAEGRLFWIMDAYTTSAYLPYSERFVPQVSSSVSNGENVLSSEARLARFRDSNYVRNSVKVVVDAYNGSVDFYLFDGEDPLIRTWQRVFPDMFKKKEEMPAVLRDHVRYPVDLLLLQGLVYAKYHMTEPTVFYNQEDLWVRATEKYYNQQQPVEPYYIMWKLPGSDHPEFVLMMPFTPKNRQVSIGWIAGMCDGENYGRFLAYKFPKEKRVLGPQQVETKIDQDRFLSGQLTLWDQRGSRVIRGNVLAIPLEETIIYVEPIYLQAETAAYPELRLVAVMHDDQLSYADSFDKALQGLFGEGDGQPGQAPAARGVARSMAELIQSANQSFETYIEAMGAKRFDAAANALSQLQSLLQQLSGREGETRKQ